MSKNTRSNLACLLLSVVVTFLGAEVFFRVYKGGDLFHNFLAHEQTLLTAGFPVQYDAQLGWIPQAGFSESQNTWGTTVTIYQHGIRSNGLHARLFSSAAPLILAVGDSFTFGAQVSDWDTWPAILERLLKKKVLNGGVFGYGVDQIYLRTEQLLKIFTPETILISLYPDDISRCELSERTAIEKPYFMFVNGQLSLQNVPVPPPNDRLLVGNVRHLFGYSCVIHTVMMSLNPGYWLQGKNWHRNTRVHQHGVEIACALLQRLEALGRAKKIQMYLILQYAADLHSGQFTEVFHCFHPTSLHVVDLKGPLAKLRRYDKPTFTSFFDGHMTPAGNAWVAAYLQERIFQDDEH